MTGFEWNLKFRPTPTLARKSWKNNVSHQQLDPYPCPRVQLICNGEAKVLQGRRVPLGTQGSLFLIPFHLHHGAPHAQLHCMTQMEHTRKMKKRVDYSLASFHPEFLKYTHTSSVVLRRQCELQRVKFSSGTSDFLLVSNAHESRMQFGSSDAALKFCYHPMCTLARGRSLRGFGSTVHFSGL